MPLKESSAWDVQNGNAHGRTQIFSCSVSFKNCRLGAFPDFSIFMKPSSMTSVRLNVLSRICRLFVTDLINFKCRIGDFTFFDDDNL